MRIVVQATPFDLGAEAAGFAGGKPGMGAIVTFTGVVRDNANGTLERMGIEHYPGMTEKAITQIAEQAKARWSLGDVLVIHRHGELRPGEMIMMVATASRHRKDAFEAAEFLMDYLKSRAPFWKQEITRHGAEWVAAREEDEDALGRWTPNQG
ncbi:molybdopterin synthase subunit MoaE [Salinihabitans flavidus]|uniref:Molybdopterin synthase catalytic subunit n=1 Tax=Salinihabitans flavidus TaxID=569882 RepID=A0A1H8SF51_9RHOB|nr:molybdenum cofactor biosynthesis protein MoaE [Salinihabitans flavidus]SEO77659.1 molybdopterin synthase subunit MoaE [Salinihabitans flavidus]